MLRTHAPRTARRIGVFATVTMTLPLCLVSCASPGISGPPAAELRAATGSDLLDVQTEQVYHVSEVQLLAPIDTTELGADVQDQVTPSGYMIMQDGVITAAELGVSVAGITEATFVLTEPTVLRREGRDEGVVYATGTLSVNGLEQHGTSVRLLPSVLTDRAAEFDVTFAIPGNLLMAGDHPGIEEISAHVALTAE
ncbi:hypothetical protein MUN76_04825 [Leucobacter rhizosphaerae]|uniref:Uncharacterized protein n=1 Tax=Leucobacter rhizosphaerae TaxID=2932245 RepID=A0ABY4FYR0_9MICO|nr:hypothetical protein [Leucobacter rhizosphaerae]UOQ61299.1 hypothetical protein MUN76_04825 [Leucobacter rhizosphaerae]